MPTAKAAPKVLTCTLCGDFEYGRWFGCQGDITKEHEVEPKTYYSEFNAYTVCIVPGRKMLDEAGNVHFTNDVVAQFTNGQYETTSPRIQAKLDVDPSLQTHDQYVAQRTPPALTAARQK